MIKLGQQLRLYQFLLLKSLGLVAAMGACVQPTTFVPGHTDRFTAYVKDDYAQANQILQGDYVFSVDFSYSMSQGKAGQSNKLEQLYNAMEGFKNDLNANNIDYNIGFVKGNSHAGSVSTISSNFVAPFITRQSSADGLDSSIMAQIENVGAALNENRNFLLESALRTVKAQQAAFIRPAAQLIFVFISDSDDQGTQISNNRTVNYYSTELKKLKSNAAYVSGRSFTVGAADNCAIQNSYDVAGTRIAQVAQAIDSTSAQPGCLYSPLSTLLQNLARDASKTTKRFVLRGKPASGSVQVFVNGSEVPTNSGVWSYQSASNEVVFADGQEPAFNAQLEIRYDMNYPLAKNPKVDSIVVTINGSNVPQSASNGWQHVSSGNRLEFFGSFKPRHNDDVRVTYTVQ